MKLYSGRLWYWKGEWKKDVNGKPYIARDVSSIDYEGVIELKEMIASSVEQLSFIVSKQIEEEHKLGYPIAIDMDSTQLAFTEIDTVNKELEAFENDFGVEV